MAQFSSIGGRASGVTLCIAMTVLLAARTGGQTTNTRGRNPYGLDAAFIQDPFYNPTATQYGYSNPYPDPGLFPPQYRLDPATPTASNAYYNNPNPNPNPAYYNPNSPAPSNQYRYSASLNPANQGGYTYSGYPYQPNSNAYATAGPPAPATTAAPPPRPRPRPLNALPASGGRKESEVDEGGNGGGGGPVFNTDIFRPLPARGGWPYGSASVGTATGGSFGSGRLYSLPSGLGLLERVRAARSRAYRQQPYSYVSNMADSPLLYMMALGGW